jgi:hypothetical protein
MDLYTIPYEYITNKTKVSKNQRINPNTNTNAKNKFYIKGKRIIKLIKNV